MNEDGSETVEDVPGDSGAHNPLLAAVASTVAASTPAASAAATTASTAWQEGVNYTRLVPAQPTAVPAGQVEVLEFFWYACPHCYAIDPLVESWKKTKPAYISFSRVPVMWSEGHRSLARLYYTLESLGKLDQLHGEIFKEIHVNGNPLGRHRSEQRGARRSAFRPRSRRRTAFPKRTSRTAYHSFAVEPTLQRADELVQRYRIDGVPTFVDQRQVHRRRALRRRPGASADPGRRSRGTRAQALARRGATWSHTRAAVIAAASASRSMAPAKLEVADCNCSHLQQIRDTCI